MKAYIIISKDNCTEEDKEKMIKLLEDAGFKNGKDFYVVRNIKK